MSWTLGVGGIGWAVALGWLGMVHATRADEPAPPPPSTTTTTVASLTYANDIAPIVQAKCQTCHRTGGVAPFGLTSFAQVKRWSAMIAEVVEQGRMPPWHANPAYGSFANDRSLTADQKRTLLSWIKQGCAPGDLDQAPPNPVFPGEWSIGTPDLVLTMPEPYKIKANGTMPYQWAAIPTGFTEDRWIESIEVKPGNKAVVHHVLVFVGRPGALRDQGRDPTSRQLGGYVPGDVNIRFPEGVAKKIPAGSTLLLQLHYTPNGKATTDQTSVGLIFAKQPPKYEAKTHGIFQTRFEIPPHASNHEVVKTYRVPADVKLLSLWPHMHLRGKDFRFTFRFPDGREEILLDVPSYDFAWQTVYQLKEPRLIPAGTVIECVAHFDNSENNPANPDPNATVRWGEQTDDEMMIGYLDYLLVRSDDPNPADADANAQVRAESPRNPERRPQIRERLLQRLAEGARRRNAEIPAQSPR
ncbi:alkyl hydroperoxide reductase/thiol specific antioxidant/Mal allergen [Isosphaera pallida ATCC 43644]|uniref:Alkyl hydroperoxide reductase/thiol specific antioxidant/Mal allergen n=1 Tax=Isosphaera pallida (strain ATCC 43644 / DSM 9630 / IS1B) TaxID=575540 RepID=E8R5T0_ISOPI|nr:alkyl hydroperoxide reductase/thiol specific antioxidant/Mal allergen [Isosphaera pallida]ADV62837.1 alkyl hydroperoxide reductase/thiol specific antioxidant/Mal allergen [Isosphaera pallida ATCC 43644]